MVTVWLVVFAEAIICNFCKESQSYINNIDSISILLVIIASFAFALFVVKSVKYKAEYFTLLGGYGLRIGFLLWDRYCSKIFKLPNTGFDADFYHQKALRCMSDYSIMENDKYAQIVAFIYNHFGPSRIMAQFINVLLAMTALVIMLKIMNLLDINEKAKQITLKFGAFLPNFAIINACLLRETVIIFLITVSLYFFVLWWKNGKWGNAIIACLLTIAAAYFHTGAIAPLFGYVFCMALYDRKKNSLKINKKTILICVLFAFSFAILNSVAGDKLFEKVNKYGSAEAITEHVDEGTGDSAYDVTFTTGNATVDMVVNTPLRIFYFIFSPVPWNWRGLNDIIAFFFSALFFGMCYILSWYVLKDKKIENKTIITAFLIFAIVTAFVFAWGVSNAGTALRHREKFTIQYLILFALCADRLHFETLFDAFTVIKSNRRTFRKSGKQNKLIAKK